MMTYVVKLNSSSLNADIAKNKYSLLSLNNMEIPQKELHPESYASAWGYLDAGVELFTKRFEIEARVNGYNIEPEVINMMEKMLLNLKNNAIKKSEKI